jgi:hypothetical protein
MTAVLPHLRARRINSFVPKPPFHDDAPPLKINGHVATAK